MIESDWHVNYRNAVEAAVVKTEDVPNKKDKKIVRKKKVFC